MKKPMSILVCAAIAAGISVTAAARGAGGAGGGGMGHATAGGPPASSAALENSNGRFSEDRDKGLDRAEDRMSAQGAKHEKATGEVKRKKPRSAQQRSTSKDD